MGVCQVVGFVTDEDFSGSLVANLYQIFPADSTMRGSIVGMIEFFTFEIISLCRAAPMQRMISRKRSSIPLFLSFRCHILMPRSTRHGLFFIFSIKHIKSDTVRLALFMFFFAQSFKPN